MFRKPYPNEYDVIVAGGGPAGIAAAVSAARLGAKTALIERYGILGGMLIVFMCIIDYYCFLSNQTVICLHQKIIL